MGKIESAVEDQVGKTVEREVLVEPEVGLAAAPWPFSVLLAIAAEVERLSAGAFVLVSEQSACVGL